MSSASPIIAQRLYIKPSCFDYFCLQVQDTTPGAGTAWQHALRVRSEPYCREGRALTCPLTFGKPAFEYGVFLESARETHAAWKPPAQPQMTWRLFLLTNLWCENCCCASLVNPSTEKLQSVPVPVPSPMAHSTPAESEFDRSRGWRIATPKVACAEFRRL